MIPSDEDCERKIGRDARAKLQNRLTLQEYVCYLTKKCVRNLDAYSRAKAAPKTKSYALDADAKEDPGLQREGVGTTGTGEESFEPAFEDASDPDFDGEVRLKASAAPLKVHHQLTQSQRLQAMIFHRQKHTKFVRDMISAGLFPLTADEESLHRTVEEQRQSGLSSGNPREEQMRLKEKTPMITQTLYWTRSVPPCPRMELASTACRRGGLPRTLAEMTQWSQLQTAKPRVQKQNGEPLASHLRQWLKRWLHLRSLRQDLSWLRSNCLLADGLLKQWMLHCRKKRTDALAKPHAACVSFDWRGWHWKDYYHFRTHAGCFLSFFSGQTWRRRAIHDFHL